MPLVDPPGAGFALDEPEPVVQAGLVTLEPVPFIAVLGLDGLLAAPPDGVSQSLLRLPVVVALPGFPIFDPELVLGEAPIEPDVPPLDDCALATPNVRTRTDAAVRIRRVITIAPWLLQNLRTLPKDKIGGALWSNLARYQAVPIDPHDWTGSGWRAKRGCRAEGRLRKIEPMAKRRGVRQAKKRRRNWRGDLPGHRQQFLRRHARHAEKIEQRENGDGDTVGDDLGLGVRVGPLAL